MSTARPIPLGPFELHHAIAKGAMGQVWRGVHKQTGLPVAIKVIGADFASDPRYKASFRNEVATLARLDHPGIIAIYDYGLLPDDIIYHSGELRPQSPYLAMELATHGSVEGLPALTLWPHLRNLLLDILDALSHAHARDIVHRDLKPANLLLGPDADGVVRIKLSDFGVAHDFNEDENTPSATSAGPQAGTPLFMAPEQFTGRWRDFGPWTDLYALGCLAYLWACGAPPYDGNNFVGLSVKHTQAPIPPVHPRFEVPRRLDDWIQCLLQKAPSARFQTAADAAFALQQLDDDRPVTAPPPLRGRPVMPGLHGDQAAPDARPPHATSYVEHTGTAVDVFRLPPVPTDWRQVTHRPPLPRLEDAGVGLIGIREPSFVGREPLRDALWEDLRRVHERGRPALIAIHAETGLGKSRLAEWLARQAQQAGAATVLRTVHDPIGEPLAGITRMLERYFRCDGLSRAQLDERLHDLHVGPAAPLPHRFADGLTELFAPLTRATADQLHSLFHTHETLHALLIPLLKRIAADRPAVLLFDNAQWGADAIALCRAILDYGGDLPILAILTVRSDALVDRPLEAQQLDLLLQHPRAHSLALTPLQRGEAHMFVQRLLPLAGELAATVAERAGGNPQHILQLLEDLAQRQVLVPGPGGFHLTQDADVELPEALYELWSERLFLLLSRMANSRAATATLQLAAVLGKHVMLEEWQLACRLARLPFDPVVADLLVERGWAQAHSDRWIFTDDALRDVLLRNAHDDGFLHNAHLACAEMLLQRYGLDDGPAAERRIQHLVEADKPDLALEPLLDAIRLQAQQLQHNRANALLEQYDVLLQAAHLPDHDARRGAHLVIRADLLMRRGLLEEAADLAQRAVTLATDFDWPRVKARACLVLGNVFAQQGKASRARFQFETARHVAQVLAEPVLNGLAVSGLGSVDAAQGKHAQARRLLEQAIQFFDQGHDPDGLTSAKTQLALIARAEGQTDEAERLLLEALVQAQTARNPYGEAQILNNIGDIARQRRDLDKAARYYHDALELSEAHGGHTIHISRFNIALVLLERQRFDKAVEALAPLEQLYLDTGNHLFLAFTHFLLMAATAGLPDLEACQRHTRRARELFERTRVVDPDLANVATLAADLLVARYEHSLAQSALELARDQWKALNRADKAQEAERRLKAMKQR